MRTVSTARPALSSLERGQAALFTRRAARTAILAAAPALMIGLGIGAASAAETAPAPTDTTAVVATTTTTAPDPATVTVSPTKPTRGFVTADYTKWN
jgi:hypothetical protein